MTENFISRISGGEQMTKKDIEVARALATLENPETNYGDLVMMNSYVAKLTARRDLDMQEYHRVLALLMAEENLHKLKIFEEEAGRANSMLSSLEKLNSRNLGNQN